MVCEGKSGNALIDCLAQKAAARRQANAMREASRHQASATDRQTDALLAALNKK